MPCANREVNWLSVGVLRMAQIRIAIQEAPKLSGVAGGSGGDGGPNVAVPGRLKFKRLDHAARTNRANLSNMDTSAPIRSNRPAKLPRLLPLVLAATAATPIAQPT